jgi:pimeloyl-ACP methyl ester carboxylesterase
MLLNVAGQPAYAYTGGRPFAAELPCICFVHGAAHDHSVWALQSRYFAHHGRGVLALDLPGHGRSKGEAPASIEHAADWLAACLDAAHVRSAALVGHSMGSLIALETAARFPAKVERLVLIGTASPMPVSDALLNAAEQRVQDAYEMVNQWSHSQAAQIGSHPVPGLWMTGVNMRLMQRNRPDTLHIDLLACNRYGNGVTAAAQVRCQTLLVAGERDLMTPARSSLALAGALPQAQRVVATGTGHALMTEQPDRVLDVLIDFLG